MVRPAAKRQAVTHLTEKLGISQRRACRLVDIKRSVLVYEPKPKDDHIILQRIREVLRDSPRYGCPRVHIMLRRMGIAINHKRTARIYRSNKLQLKYRKRKRRVKQPENPLPPPTYPNQVWTMDFVHDALFDGRKIRILTLVDELTRECLALECDTSISSERVVRVLKDVASTRRFPLEIGVDHGPEFTSKIMEKFAYEKNIRLRFAQPGNKNENAFIESFNGKLRDECLNMAWFTSLSDARENLRIWRLVYNELRPHTSLGGMTPKEFKESLKPKVVA